MSEPNGKYSERIFREIEGQGERLFHMESVLERACGAMEQLPLKFDAVKTAIDELRTSLIQLLTRMIIGLFILLIIEAVAITGVYIKSGDSQIGYNNQKLAE